MAPTGAPSIGHTCAIGVRRARPDRAATVARGQACRRHRLLDLGDAALEHHEVLAAGDRARVQQQRRRALERRVGDDDAARDRADLEDAERGPAHQTNRNASFSVQRRSRVKCTAVVRPSPVGLAMVNEV